MRKPLNRGTAPLREYYNPDVLAMIPRDADRVVGCGGGTMAREYRKINGACDYIGIEVVDRYANAARAHCDRGFLQASSK